MPRYIVERTFPNGLNVPGTEESAAATLNVVNRNLDHGVTWIHSYVTDDRTKSFCVYDGPSPEAIRQSASVTNLPVDRITSVRVLDPYFHVAAAVEV